VKLFWDPPVWPCTEFCCGVATLIATWPYRPVRPYMCLICS